MMQLRRLLPSLAIFAALSPLAGCKPDKAVHVAETLNPSPGARFTPPPNAGSVTGVVNFAGTPPPRVAIDMSMDPGCAMAGDNKSEQVVASDGKLANVYVYVKSGLQPSSAPAGAPPVVLDQKGCRYTPHVIAVQQGGTVEFRNSDPTMHNIHIVLPGGGSPIDVSQGPMGAAQTRQFTAPAVMVPVRCNNHPWMNAFLNVAPSPYFAVTGADGKFTIKDLPPGTYTLAAVQEKLGEQDIQVTVPPSATAKAAFGFGAK